jgi:hypothetical protein
MNGNPWTDAEIWRFLALYSDMENAKLARKFGRTTSSINAAAGVLGVHKSAEYCASLAWRSRLPIVGRLWRFPKGHIPMNKGIKGWQAGGRSVHTQFKKGQFPFNRDPEFYVMGALRVNTDGYIDMRVSFDPGAKGWRGLHRILWEDAHGPVPTGHIVSFKDGDRLNVELRNLKLISLADNMRRNSLHNLPKPLVSTIHLLCALKRTLNRRHRDEKQDSRPA